MKFDFSNIIKTMDSTQTEASYEKIDKSFIIQGCAGSGKTAILLHRPSYLAYNNPDYAWSRVALVTPNEEFVDYVRNLFGELELKDNNIQLYSLEKYYASIIEKYDHELSFKIAESNSEKNKSGVIFKVDEITVNPNEGDLPAEYLERIYAPSFFNIIQNDFKKYAAEIESKKQDIAAEIHQLSTLQKTTTDDWIIKISKLADKARALGVNKAVAEKYKTKSNANYIEKTIDYKSFQYVTKTLIGERIQRLRDEFKIANLGHNEFYRHDLYLLMLALSEVNGPLGEKCGNKALYIDEGQDISPTEYKLIKKINNNPVFNIYGDIDQNLTPWRGLSSWDDIKDLGIEEIKKFDIDYRNTKQICDYISKALKMDIQSPLEGKFEVEKLTTEELFENMTKYPEKAIVVMVVSDKESEFAKKVMEIRPNSEIITPAESKGFEYPKLFVNPEGMTHNEKYVAMTRALYYLTVIKD
ncbi:MAG: UvrD-helicase domain-containing protein [Lactobacillales bacterium]|jgi:DNA helicase IV|nr:UvrD-helicase domain-containing protein [Lactobacillales bacterium]